MKVSARQQALGRVPHNGDLLEAAESAGFDLIIVADKNLRYQQSLADRKLEVLELWTNHRPTLEKCFDHIRKAAESLHPGAFLALGEPPPSDAS